MNPSELRIGNYVTSTIGKWRNVPHQITGVKRDECYFYEVFEFSVPIKLIKPVKITEEILFSFGFEKNTRSYDNYVIPMKNFSILFDDDDKQWWINDDESDASCYNVCAVKYVHELQNAFNVLKKEELTLNKEL